jgi:hypothetical protein
MTRWLFTSLSALSLLLCVLTVVLWIRSHSRAEHFWLIYREGGADLFRTDCGDFTIRRSKSDERNTNVRGRVRFGYSAGPLVGSHPGPRSFSIVRRWSVFSYAAVLPPPAPAQARKSLWKFIFPAWLPVLITLMLPACWTLSRWRRLRQPRSGLCPSCGYDLRATPERCPECGEASHLSLQEMPTVSHEQAALALPEQKRFDA